MKYTLSYVNLPNSETEYYYSDWESLTAIEAFVTDKHPLFTSYQIIVVAL